MARAKAPSKPAGSGPSKGRSSKGRSSEAKPSRGATARGRAKPAGRSGSAGTAPPERRAKADRRAARAGAAKGRGGGRAGRPRAERPDWPRDGSRGLFPEPDTTRPHVRLGVLWFAVVVASLAAAPAGLLVPYGASAALGAAQTARAWRRAGRRANVAVAAAAAFALPLGAAVAGWGLGAAILLGTAVTVLLTPGDAWTLLTHAAATVRSWLFVGLAAASVIVVADVDQGAGIALVALTSMYDCGNYLVGADSRWPWLGVLAGILAVGVVAFSLFVLALQPFQGEGVVTYGVATAALAPLGQLAASWVLPDGRALASGLRRLDSVLLVGPGWLVLFAIAPPG